jgi:hypothetical protein
MGTEMHHSRLCAVLIDCKTSDVDQAARFWSEALGRAVDLNHPNSRGNYRMLETPADELIVEIQRVDHESRVHIDIEADDISAEVARLVLLRHKLRRERAVFAAAQEGQRESVAMRSTTSRRRSVAIELGTWRSGRSGGASGSITLG